MRTRREAGGRGSRWPPRRSCAKRLYERRAAGLRDVGVTPVETGRFGAAMAVELVNDGPFTIWLDSDGCGPDMRDRPQGDRPGVRAAGLGIA